MRRSHHMHDLKGTSSQWYRQHICAKQLSTRSNSPLRNDITAYMNTGTMAKLCILWLFALAIFALGVSSVLQSHTFLFSDQNFSIQREPNPLPLLTPSTSPHAIFQVNNTLITNTQWHNAVQNAFQDRASSGHYLGGNQEDTLAVNTQAFHSIIDPIAEQEIIQQFKLTTDVDTLYKQWFVHASSQERHTAQRMESNALYKQQQAQEQLEKNIVTSFVTLPTPSSSDVYKYYQQHPEQFARNAPQMHVQQIVVTSSQQADLVVAQLKRGISFSTVEAAYDISGSYYRAHGGDLGWVTLGGSGYPPEWSAHVLSLTAGQIGASFQINSRYYVVKCLEGPDYEPWPFRRVDDQAKQGLVMEQLAHAYADILHQKEKTMQLVLFDQQYSMVLQQFDTGLRG